MAKKKGVEQKAIITKNENPSSQENRPVITRGVGSRNVLQQAGKRVRRRTRRRI